MIHCRLSCAALPAARAVYCAVSHASTSAACRKEVSDVFAKKSPREVPAQSSTTANATNDKKDFIEPDAERLTTHVCINYLVSGGEDPPIKNDSEYPDWLFTLRTEGYTPIEELTPDDWRYWQYAIKQFEVENNIKKKMRFKSPFLQRYLLERSNFQVGKRRPHPILSVPKKDLIYGKHHF